MRKIYLFFLLCLTLFSTKGLAADFYWTGKGSSSNYNVVQNWALGSISGGVPTVVPGASDNVFFTDGAIKFDVNFNQANIVFNNFTASSTTSNYNYYFTAVNGTTKTLTVNGVMNLSQKASFISNSTGNIDNIGALILKNAPILNNNDLGVYIVFNSGTNIKITNNFNAMSIIVDNGTTLDLSNLSVNLRKNTNVNEDTAGMLKVLNSASGIKLTSTILNTETIWFVNFDMAKSDFSSSTIYIHGGAHSWTNFIHNTTLTTFYRGLIVEKADVILPNVIIDNVNNYTNRTCSIINNNNLIINNLTVRKTSVYFDTNNLTVTNLTVDKGYEYTFYGTSTVTAPSSSPNLKVTNFNFNSSSSGTTKFKSYISGSKSLAYLDIPVVAVAPYANMIANGIYSDKVVTFSNSVLENLNKNINVTSNVAIDYYWRGGGDGVSWSDTANWSLSPTAAVATATLPSSNDNVFFNTNSVIAGIINVIKNVDIHNFTVMPDFIGKTFEIFSDTSDAFTIRGSLQLQVGATLSIRNLYFVPKSTDINSPETITLNDGLLRGSTSNGDRLIVTGGGALSLKGPTFTYYKTEDANRNSFILENGSLIFDAATVNFNDFISEIALGSSFKANLYLKNSTINTKYWKYNNINNTNLNSQFTLNAGTSTINFTQSFTAAGDTNIYTIDNKLKYNNIILKNSITSVSRSLYGLFDANNVELEASAYFSAFGSSIFDTTTNSVIINQLKVYAGNLIGFTSNYRINILDKFQTINTDACQLVTILDGDVYTVNFIINPNVTDQTNTANVLTLKNYDVKNIKFIKNASYILNISGSADSKTTGYTSLTQAMPANLYWIGSASTTNQWSNSVNWTLNSDGSISSSSCSPTKFDNAHFKSYSNAKGNEVAVNNDIYINNIIFESDSPQKMLIKGNGSRDIYLGGSLLLNNTDISGFSRLLAAGKQIDPTYDPTPRHKIRLNGGNLNMRINYLNGAYYKLVDNFTSITNHVNYLTNGADVEANNITIKTGSFSNETNASGKLNIDNSSLELSNFNINSGIFTVNAANTVFKLVNNNSPYFTYLGPTTTSGVNSTFSTATLEFVDKIPTNVITGPSNGALVFKSITTRGVTFNVNSDVTTNVLNSLSNKISIVANKELKVTEQANISGTSCDVTRSIVSATPGTRAKFTILGGATNFDYLTVKDIDANSSYQVLVFGTYSTNGGNNTSYVQFLDKTTDDSTYGFGAVYACRDIAVDKMLSASGFYPNAVTTYQWFKLTGTNADLVTPIATTRDIDLSLYGYGEYKLVINYDPSTAGACIINDQINITPLPTKPTELLDDKFCKNKVAIFDDIKIPGYKLVWYDSATSTSPILGTTPIVSGTTYYVARKTDSGNGQDCESIEREKLVLNLDACGGVYINPALRMRSF